MRKFLIAAALCFAASGSLPAQSTEAAAVSAPAIHSIPIAEKAELSKPDQTSADSARQDAYVPPDAKTRQKRYLNSLFGPVTLAKTVATAGFGTWRNSPEEWGDNWEGFGRRVASNFGKNVIKQSTTYGLDEVMKVDSRFYRSRKRDVGSRIKNAVISPVTARNREGKRVVGIPRIAGTYTAGIVAAEAWYPDRYDWKDGVKSGTMSLGFQAAFNLIREFVWKK